MAIVYRLTAYSMVKTGVIERIEGQTLYVRNDGDGRLYSLGVNSRVRVPTKDQLATYRKHIRKLASVGATPVLPDVVMADGNDGCIDMSGDDLDTSFKATVRTPARRSDEPCVDDIPTPPAPAITKTRRKAGTVGSLLGASAEEAIKKSKKGAK
jgi:hypothetical protein